MRDQEEEEAEEATATVPATVEVKMETSEEAEEGSGEEAPGETRENGLEPGAGDPLLVNMEARRALGLGLQEDTAQDTQGQRTASQDQASPAPSPQV